MEFNQIDLEWVWLNNIKEFNKDTLYAIIFNKTITEDVWDKILDYIEKVGFTFNRRTWSYETSIDYIERCVNEKEGCVLYIQPLRLEGDDALSYTDWNYHVNEFTSECTEVKLKTLLDIIDG